MKKLIFLKDICLSIGIIRTLVTGLFGCSKETVNFRGINLA